MPSGILVFGLCAVIFVICWRLMSMGSEIRRCPFCEIRFICFRQFTIPTQPKSGNGTSLVVAWLSIFGGVLVCVGIALWTLRRFHRWPF